MLYFELEVDKLDSDQVKLMHATQEINIYPILQQQQANTIDWFDKIISIIHINIKCV